MAFRLIHDSKTHEVEIVRRRPHLVLRVDGQEHEVAALGGGGEGRDAIEVAGRSIAFVRARDGDRQFLCLEGNVYEIALAQAAEDDGASETLDEIRAPMPGRIVAAPKAAGETVARGETVVIIESMKLQLPLTAPRAGTLAALSRGVGDSVDKDEIVARLEPASGRA